MSGENGLSGRFQATFQAVSCRCGVKYDMTSCFFRFCQKKRAQ